MSRKKSLCEKLTRNKETPLYGSRAKTGQQALAAKQEVLVEYPGLQLDVVGAEEDAALCAAQTVLFQGLNSLKAEMIDLNCMAVLMKQHMKNLTHAIVDKFFDWIPIFSIYLERYMVIEEDMLMKWLEAKAGGLKGELRPSARMVARGKIQRGMADVQAVREEFRPYVPAGQTLSQVLVAVDGLTKDFISYTSTLVEQLPRAMADAFSAKQILGNRVKIMKHVVAHVGYQDFVALYTRWMGGGELLEWKTTVLFPCDFKFFSYAVWEKDMDNAHYAIAGSFGELFDAGEGDDERKEDFERARETRRRMEMEMGDGVDVEVCEEEVIDDGSDEES